YDWKELSNFLVKKIAPCVLGGIVVIWILYKVALSAFGSKAFMPDLGQVTGKVLLNGQPVAGAMVIFDPIRDAAAKEDKHKRVGSALAYTDESGRYELTYGPEAKGAPVGECRIQIQAPGKDIPADYVGSTSKQTRSVKSGKQVIDFELKK